MSKLMKPLAGALDILQSDGGPKSDHRNMSIGYLLPTLRIPMKNLEKFLPKKDSNLMSGVQLLKFCEPLAFHLYFSLSTR